MDYLSIPEAAKELNIEQLEIIKRIKSSEISVWINFINDKPGRVFPKYNSPSEPDITVNGCWKLNQAGDTLRDSALTMIENAETVLRHGIKKENPRKRWDYIYITQNDISCCLLDPLKIIAQNKLTTKEYWAIEIDAEKLSVFADKIPDDAILVISTEDIERLKTTTEKPQETETTAPVVAEGPAPLTRNEIANCFAGLRGWDVKRWKSELSSPDAWLADCQHHKGTRGRGGYESTWWPVRIAVAMVDRNATTVKLASARFKTMEPLKPWRDAWENNYPEAI